MVQCYGFDQLTVTYAYQIQWEWKNVHVTMSAVENAMPFDI